jgi:hypothetical protein
MWSVRVLACVRPDAVTNSLANYLKDHPEPRRTRSR